MDEELGAEQNLPHSFSDAEMFPFQLIGTRRGRTRSTLSAGISAPGERALVAADTAPAPALATYPPVDTGIPSVPTEELLRANADLVRRIKLAYGADDATYERDVVTLIRRFAAYVHLLPATPDNYFRGHGGLLRMGLETGFYALQATDSHIFSGRTTITKRRNLEPRWRHATFLAGLCCELHRTLSHLVVADESGREWRPYLESLHDWLAADRRNRYFLRWLSNAQEMRALGVFALPHIVPAETLAYLAEDNGVVVPHMLACISGMPIYRDANVLEQLVRRATALVIDRDLSASADRFGKPQIGAHLERYLLDAMRRLILSSPAWVVNGDKSRVWYGKDGLYLVWPNAVADMVALLEGDHLPGIPKAPDTIFEILAGAGVFEAQASGEPRWAIQPPTSESTLEAVRLSSPSILLSALDQAPEALPSLAPHKKPQAATTAASPAKGKQLELEVTVGAAASKPSRTQHDAPSASGNPNDASVAIPTMQEAEPSRGEASAFSLNAPVRLNPAVKSVLAEIIDTMNRDGSNVAACTIAEGVFVPLSEFERRQLETALVIRALSECAMLVAPADRKTKTFLHHFRNQDANGVVIHPRFIAGLDPADFLTQAPAGGSSARP